MVSGVNRVCREKSVANVQKKNGYLLSMYSHHYLKIVKFFYRVISISHRIMKQARSGEHIIDEVSRFKTVKFHDSKIVIVPSRHWEEEFSGRHEAWTHRWLAEVCATRCTETLCVDEDLDKITIGWDNGLFFYQDACGYVMWRTQRQVLESVKNSDRKTAPISSPVFLRTHDPVHPDWVIRNDKHAPAIFEFPFKNRPSFYAIPFKLCCLITDNIQEEKGLLPIQFQSGISEGQEYRSHTMCLFNG